MLGAQEDVTVTAYYSCGSPFLPEVRYSAPRVGGPLVHQGSVGHHQYPMDRVHMRKKNVFMLS